MSARKSGDFIADAERQFEWYAVNAGYRVLYEFDVPFGRIHLHFVAHENIRSPRTLRGVGLDGMRTDNAHFEDYSSTDYVAHYLKKCLSPS
jgi:hypothetical protein